MFTGHQWDGESGLYYAPYRYYSPFQARWTTRDPLGMIDGPNVYAYVRGDPLGFSDPTGLFTIEGDCTLCPGGTPMKGFIRSAIEVMCGNDYLKRVEDTALRQCIAKRCESGTIKCTTGGECADNTPDVGGRDETETAGWCHGAPGVGDLDYDDRWCRSDSPAYICMNVTQYLRGPRHWKETVLHEWAHTCGWAHSHGGGIP